MSSEHFVTHFVLVRNGKRPETGERIATWAIPPELVGAHGAAIDHAAELERQRWARIAIANGYVDGWAVVIHRERGFRRSIFPAAALAGLNAQPQLELVKPGGRTHG